MRARRVIVAVPLAIAGQIDYQPTLPLDRMFLNQRMPSGAIVKISFVMCRWVDGAIRSGERAAEEVLARETTAATEPV